MYIEKKKNEMAEAAENWSNINIYYHDVDYLVNTFRWFSIRIEHQINQTICHFSDLLQPNYTNKESTYIFLFLVHWPNAIFERKK